ncbi:MAG: hypothetical protein JO010_11420 [Alphaproteobacteria bacterium]|nr:hypothetical protein [Alphaproteobacteria bacterium]
MQKKSDDIRDDTGRGNVERQRDRAVSKHEGSDDAPVTRHLGGILRELEELKRPLD